MTLTKLTVPDQGAPMVTDHVWRAKPTSSSQVPARDRPCEYMSCRRPLAEHARAYIGRHQ